ncbi:MAG: SDR family oxidoreductase [Proteobacteria bacterium]|nr:SDR family oxidoreductase [Pseudomonadota bacterium]
MARIEDIYVGQMAELLHVVTTDDLNRFVALTGDDNRLHVDPVYAANTSFKKPVVHGMLGVSFISTVIGTKLPGDGALWFAQNLEFILPVRVGDHLTIRVEVISKDERSKIIELKTDILNQRRQKVTTGVAKVKIVEHETEEPIHASPSTKRVALVVGGSGGIGSAICRAMAVEGFDVAIHYWKNGNYANQIADQIKPHGNKIYVCQADILDESSVKEMVEQVVRHLGPITVLVNCTTAKIAAIKFSDLIWSDFEEHLGTTIHGAFSLVRSVLPFMEKARSGKIIHINSLYVDSPETNLLPYITAKGALMGFSRALALDLAPKGIQVNSVSAGMTDTEQIADVPERVRLMTAAQTPLRRLAKPEDVADAVVFLASDRANFMAGETIRVNGGQVML